MKIECISCGMKLESEYLDGDGICEPCNLEDYCHVCNQHELDCACDDGAADDSFVYGFGDDDFGNEDDPHDELDDWEGDDFDEDTEP